LGEGEQVTIYYYGCIDRVGHNLFAPDGKTFGCNRRPEGCPFSGSRLDGSYAMRTKEQPQGVALWHHIQGWSIISFWDRSVDPRGGSSSTFVAEGLYTFDEMVEKAKLAFPQVWKRFKFEVREYK
jgi:hypothetical protein